MNRIALEQQLLERAVGEGLEASTAVAGVVGARAAATGAPLHEVMDLVERAYAGRRPDRDVMRAACVGWSESMVALVMDVRCEDPLTSLATVAYLRTRLGDLQREAHRAGRRMSDTHALVVVEVPDRVDENALSVSLRAVEVGEAMRIVWAGGETVARVAEARFAALVDQERADRTTVRLLELLISRTSAGQPAPSVWVEELPEGEGALGQLVLELTR